MNAGKSTGVAKAASEKGDKAGTCSRLRHSKIMQRQAEMMRMTKVMMVKAKKMRHCVSILCTQVRNRLHLFVLSATNWAKISSFLQHHEEGLEEVN
ncbi:hypothetical protein C1H46_044270 [Malus baccata]|uniref:Uncharacterized protein n=1 Tax=Malus baccata TaxID=106549 RepID=A0A540K7K1_MALBA|nr:hypothetical protein C1H46_044270 [Malus baccata]